MQNKTLSNEKQGHDKYFNKIKIVALRIYEFCIDTIKVNNQRQIIIK